MVTMNKFTFKNNLSIIPNARLYELQNAWYWFFHFAFKVGELSWIKTARGSSISGMSVGPTSV